MCSSGIFSQQAQRSKRKAKKDHPNPLNCNLCYNWLPLTIQLEAWGNEWVNDKSK